MNTTNSGQLPEPSDPNRAGAQICAYNSGDMIAYGLRERAAQRERCVAWVDARCQAFVEQFGSVDPDTGSVEFGRGAQADAWDEYVGELAEISEGLRGLL